MLAFHALSRVMEYSHRAGIKSEKPVCTRNVIVGELGIATELGIRALVHFSRMFLSGS